MCVKYKIIYTPWCIIILLIILFFVGKYLIWMIHCEIDQTISQTQISHSQTATYSCDGPGIPLSVVREASSSWSVVTSHEDWWRVGGCWLTKSKERVMWGVRSASLQHNRDGTTTELSQLIVCTLLGHCHRYSSLLSLLFHSRQERCWCWSVFVWTRGEAGKTVASTGQASVLYVKCGAHREDITTYQGFYFLFLHCLAASLIHNFFVSLVVRSTVISTRARLNSVVSGWDWCNQ